MNFEKYLKVLCESLLIYFTIFDGELWWIIGKVIGICANQQVIWVEKNILAKKAVKEKDSLRKKRLNSRIAYAGGTQNRLS